MASLTVAVTLTAVVMAGPERRHGGLGPLVAIGLALAALGWGDQWGDYLLVWPIAVTVGVVILVPGLVGLGRWLSSETPVDLDSPEYLPIA